MGDERTVTWLSRSSRPTCKGKDGDCYFIDVLLLTTFFKTFGIKTGALAAGADLTVRVRLSVSSFLLTGGKMCFNLKTVQRRNEREKKTVEDKRRNCGF